MTDILFRTKLEKRGIYFFFTKYAVLSGWLICFFTIMVDIRIDNLKFNFIFLACLSLILSICQIGYSWSFPHEVIIFCDKIVGVGPWNIRHTITFDNIKTIVFNKKSTVIQKKYGINKILIEKSLDPHLQLQNNLFNILKKYTGIRFVKSTYI
jgi:hypothetical protein